MGLWRSIKNEIALLKGDKGENKVYSSQKSFITAQDAKVGFTEAKKRLFEVDAWSDMEGINSTFTVYTANGQKAPRRTVQQGDFIKIDLPGIDTENWVEVAALTQNQDTAEFTVRPSEKPNHPNAEVKHFFSKEAKSTFRVTRQDNVIHAYEIGQNEVVNNRGKEAGDRKALNTIIATGGWAGFQKLQWEKLTAFLVDNR